MKIVIVKLIEIVIIRKRAIMIAILIEQVGETPLSQREPNSGDREVHRTGGWKKSFKKGTPQHEWYNDDRREHF